MESSPDSRAADLVLEGGGVKGLALVGAVRTLSRAGYAFHRIAGTSAGAIVGSVLAGLVHAGEEPERIIDIARGLEYARLRDRGKVGRVLAKVGLGSVVDGLSLAFEDGVFEGEYLHGWLTHTLAELGVRKFGDLRLDDDPHGYRLVVMASDVSRQRLVRLPWDYADYGLDPDEQLVADAVRASTSIPFFFEPVTMRTPRGVSTLVDGGVLSNFPVTIFDRADGKQPRWPTFGIRLSASERDLPHTQPVAGPVSLALAVAEAMMEACDARHIDEPVNLARSIFIDTLGVSAVDFGITEEQQAQLLAAGEKAATRFLASWNFQEWLSKPRGGVQ